MTIVAALQMISSPQVSENIDTAQRLIAQAATAGAKMILLPEYWAIMGYTDKDKIQHAENLGAGVLQRFLQQMAQQHDCWIIGGTIPIVSPIPNKVFNTILVYNPLGECISHYHKMHLFNFANQQESYEESATIVAGNEVATFNSPIGKVGLSICYDLRFPELYRAMGNCSLITVPAAFTYTTGKAHWEILLRARAIENQCYVLASGQGGLHKSGRQTWGHSMLINPWGEIEQVLAEGEGYVLGNINELLLQQVRTTLPALNHQVLHNKY